MPTSENEGPIDHRDVTGIPKTEPVDTTGIQAGSMANEPGLERPNLDRALVHGIAWTAGAKWASQVLSWAATLAVARLLSPADYGIVGMGVLFLALVALVNDFGVTSAIVTLRDMTETELRRLNAFALAIGVTCFGIGAAIAVPLSIYFRAPVLVPVIIVQSVGFILSSFQSVPSARLQRDFAFRRLASIEVTRSIVASAAALLFAYLGARYWTLVFCELLAITTHSALLVRARPTAFLWRGFGQMQRAVVFSGRTLMGNVSWYAYSNTDFLVAGRMLGAAALGSYGFAWQLTSLPVEKVTALVGRVTPAIFSAHQDDPAAIRRYIHRITEGIALITIPATTGIALVAGDIIPLMFGAKWSLAVGPLRILAACMVLRSIIPVVMNAMKGVGDVRYLMWHGVATAAVFPLCFYIGARRGGIDGIAYTWLIAYPIAVLPLYWRAHRTRLITVRGYLAAILPAFEASALMVPVVLLTRWGLLRWDPSAPLSALCAVEILAGAVAYGAVLLARHRRRITELRALLLQR
jgi:teichuronic acid exporter